MCIWNHFEVNFYNFKIKKKLELAISIPAFLFNSNIIIKRYFTLENTLIWFWCNVSCLIWCCFLEMKKIQRSPLFLFEWGTCTKYNIRIYNHMKINLSSRCCVAGHLIELYLLKNISYCLAWINLNCLNKYIKMLI
jgi:hypothetical protein